MSAESGRMHGHASSSGDKKSKRKPKRKETYSVYIYKVLKQVSKYFPVLRAVSHVKLILPVAFNPIKEKKRKSASI